MSLLAATTVPPSEPTSRRHGISYVKTTTSKKKKHKGRHSSKVARTVFIAEVPKEEDVREEVFLTRPQLQYRRMLFAFRFIVHLVIAALLVVGAAGKAFRNGQTSIDDYWRHFTNWAWTLHTIYFCVTLLTNTLFQSCADLNTFMISFFYFGLQGIAWSVAVLVYVFIGINADFIEQYMKSFGGNTSDSTVLLGNAFYHGFPVLFYLLYSIAYHKDIWLAMHWQLESWYPGIPERAVFAIYNIYVLPVLFYGSYLIFFDPSEVYGIDVQWWISMLIVIGTITVVSAPAYYFYTPPADIRTAELHAVDPHSLRYLRDVKQPKKLSTVGTV